MADKTLTAKQIINALDPERLTQEDFLLAVENIVGILNEHKQVTKGAIENIRTELHGVAAETSKGNAGEITSIKAQLNDLLGAKLGDLDTHTAEALTKLDTALAAVKSGADGINPDPEVVTQEVLKRIIIPTAEDVMNGLPAFGERTRDALELLQGEERLDASAIKNLPQRVKDINRSQPMGVHGPLWGLTDVDVTGLVVGQSIKWDGIRWIPYTPVGGSGATAVYTEVVSGSATTFTLAHTPTSSAVLRVYANGQRLFPTTDYSLSGATITTVSSWSASSIAADYEW